MSEPGNTPPWETEAVSQPTNAWDRVADRLKLERGCFGDWAATDFMLDVARKADTARDDLDYIQQALRTLKLCKAPIGDVRDRLKLEAQACRHRINAFPKKGQQHREAHFVAEKVAQAFVQAGRNLGKGTKSDGVSPSTVFGKAVAIAFEELGVKGGSRGAVNAAADLPLRISSRID